MKKVIPALVLLFLSGWLFAQNPDTEKSLKRSKNMMLDFSGGLSVPLGSFAARDSGESKAGYAASGYHLRASFLWMGKSDFGLAFQYSYQHNPLHSSANNVMIDGSDSIMMGPGSWNSHSVMVGPALLKRFGKLYLDVRLVGGLVVSFFPGFNTPDPGDLTRTKLSHNMATGFAVELSAGAGYMISDHIGLNVKMSVFEGFPVANKQYESKLIGYEEKINPETGLPYYVPVYSAPVDYSIRKVISLFNPSVGISYKF